MKTILTIIKKELKRFFTDKRMLIGMLLPGILIFCIYSIMGDIMKEQTNPKIDEFKVCVVNEPEEVFDDILTVEGWTITRLDLTYEEAIEKLKKKELDLYIVYEENFYDKMLTYSPGDSSLIAPEVEIYYNSTSNGSTLIYSYYVGVLDSIESSLSNKFDINRNIDGTYDVASSEDMTVYIISSMLPFLLLTFLFTGCMAICSESIAGEKERGTIATLLITPAKRSHIVIGKMLSLGITGLCSSLVSFAGLMLSLPSLLGTEFSFSAYPITTILLMLLLIFVTVLLFTTVLMIISTFSKSVKEASSYSSPLMIVIMLIGVTNMMNTAATSNIILYTIPIYNVLQCLIGVFSLDISPLYFIVCILSNIVYIGLGVSLLIKMFNNEKIIFNM